MNTLIDRMEMPDPVARMTPEVVKFFETIAVAVASGKAITIEPLPAALAPAPAQAATAPAGKKTRATGRQNRSKRATGGDILSDLGVKKAYQIAGGIKIILAVQKGATIKHFDVSGADTLAFWRKHPSIEEAGTIGARLRKIMFEATATGLYFLLAAKNADEANRLFEKLAAPELNIPTNHPTRMLRDRVAAITELERQTGSRGGQDEITALTIEAWNHLRKGTTSLKKGLRGWQPNKDGVFERPEIL